MTSLVSRLGGGAHGRLGLELGGGGRGRLLDEDADDAHQYLIPAGVGLAALAVAGAADSRVALRGYGCGGGGGVVMMMISSSSSSSSRSSIISSSSSRNSIVIVIDGRRRRSLELAGFEDGLAIGGVEPGGELGAHRDRVQPPVVAAALLGELAGLERGLPPRVGPVEQLHHLLVLHDLVAERQALGARGLQERLLLFAEHVWARREPVCPETFYVACFEGVRY